MGMGSGVRAGLIVPVRADTLGNLAVIRHHFGEDPVLSGAVITLGGVHVLEFPA